MEIVPQVPCCLPVWYLDSPQQRDIFNSWLRCICSWFSATPDRFLYNSFPASCSSFFIYAVDSACLREASCTSPSSISAHLPQVAEIILNSALAVQRAQLPPSQLTDTSRVGIINEQPAAQGSSNTTLLIRKLITAFRVEVSNNFAHTNTNTRMLSQVSADCDFFTFEDIRRDRVRRLPKVFWDSVLLPWHPLEVK